MIFPNTTTNLQDKIEEFRTMLILVKVRQAQSISEYNSVKELRDMVLESPYVPDEQRTLLIEQEKEWKDSLDELATLVTKLESEISEMEEKKAAMEELEDILSRC